MPVLELRPPAQSSPGSVRTPLSPSKLENGCRARSTRSVNNHHQPACDDNSSTHKAMSASSTLSSIQDTSSMAHDDDAAYRTAQVDLTVDESDDEQQRQSGQWHRHGDRRYAHPIDNQAGDDDEDDDMELQSEQDFRNGGTRRTSLATAAVAQDMMLARSISKTSIASRDSLDEEDDLPVLHVEVRLRQNLAIRNDILQRQVAAWLRTSFDTFEPESEAQGWQEVDLLNKHVDRIWLGECSEVRNSVSIAASQVQLEIHVYSPPSASRTYDVSTSEGDDYENGNDDDNVPAATVMHLPNRALDGLWTTLVYEDDVKSSLLSYIYSTVLFSDAMVDFDVVTWNRVVLLHGPPGTGKTSLCRALAQKLAIRLSSRYDSGKLVEINSHSLFSKWFSESGKLVQRLFSAVTEMVDDESCFVVVLIDEVESLTTARAGAMSGREPSDALRVVNALLTQLDKLKTRKNVLVVTTSNLSDAIDGAFIDRADIKKYIGLPPPQAIYSILESCLVEIMRAGLVKKTKLLNWNGAKSLYDSNNPGHSIETNSSFMLCQLAHACRGMSGRTLRRLPVIAHATHIKKHSRVPLHAWIEAMMKAVADERAQMDKVRQDAEGV
ncbi:hypothetical protein ACM66B_004675 [Microbotryomycetes sp. NB124-2]